MLVLCNILTDSTYCTVHIQCSHDADHTKIYTTLAKYFMNSPPNSQKHHTEQDNFSIKSLLFITVFVTGNYILVFILYSGDPENFPFHTLSNRFYFMFNFIKFSNAPHLHDRLLLLQYKRRDQVSCFATKLECWSWNYTEKAKF